MKKSNYSGFYKLSVEERLDEVVKFANLDKEDIENIKNTDALDISKADNMVENVIGRFTLPMGVALNFKINDKDYIISLALTGKQLTSEELADNINYLTITGYSTITFIIGGSYGLSRKYIKKIKHAFKLFKINIPTSII